MFIVVYSLKFISINNYLLLLIQILAGAIIYLILVKIFKLESFTYLINLIKRNLKKVIN